MREAYGSGTALVTAARAGDQRALEELVGRWLPPVYNIEGRALDAHADVDDVVQAVMIHVIRGLGDLREPEKVVR